MQMRRRRRYHADRVLVLRNRNHDLAGVQMQPRLAEARTIAINIIAENRPAHFGAMHPQLMGPPGDRLEREPAKTVAAPAHFPVGDRRLPLRIGLLPPASLRRQTPEGHLRFDLLPRRSSSCPRPTWP